MALTRNEMDKAFDLLDRFLYEMNAEEVTTIAGRYAFVHDSLYDPDKISAWAKQNNVILDIYRKTNGFAVLVPIYYEDYAKYAKEVSERGDFERYFTDEVQFNTERIQSLQEGRG